MARRLLHLRGPADLDGRTLPARRMKEAASAMVADLGGADHLTAGQRMLIERACFLSVVCEHHEARWLEEGQIDMTVYIPATNALSRVLGSLGLERRTKNAAPSLRDYIASKEPAR